MKNLFLFFCFLAGLLQLQAQSTPYERMKNRLSKSSIPLVNLTVDLAKVSKSNYIEAEMEISDYLQRTQPGQKSTAFKILLRYRGASSTRYEKKSFAVKLIDEQGEDLDANILGIREENSWILDAMAVDRLRMRNRVCFDIWNEMSPTPYATSYNGRNGTAGHFVEVYVNGVYHGLYCLSDKIDRKLLGLKKYKVADDGTVQVRGVLYKGESWGSACYLTEYEIDDTSSDTWNSWELQYPDDIPSHKTWLPLMNLIDFCAYVTDDDLYLEEYPNRFYPQNLVDYVVFTLALNVGDNAYKNTFLSNVDITKQNTFLLTPWDMDQSLGGFWDGNYYDVTASVNRYDGIAPFNRLLKDNLDNMLTRVADRWVECRKNIFSVNSVAKRIRTYANQIINSGAWKREVEKWDGNPVDLKENLQSEVDYVVRWYERNFEALNNQLLPVSAITSPEIRATLPSIYTIDGRRVRNIPVDQLPAGLYIIDGRKVMVGK